MLSPKRVAVGRVLLPNIGLKRHVRSRPTPRTLKRTRARCLASVPIASPERTNSPLRGMWVELGQGLIGGRSVEGPLPEIGGDGIVAGGEVLQKLANTSLLLG